MKNNKVYIPKDAIARHEDFDVLYDDGDLALRFQGDWKSESDKIAIIGRMGGELGHIKPDHFTLTYYIRMERWEYVFHTHRIFKHYFVEGMLWQVHGSLSKCPVNFINEKGDKKDVHVRETTFPGMGECYEVKVADVAKLRVAIASVVAMAIKESYKGKSEGEKNPNANRLEKMKRFLFTDKGKTYDQILKEEEAWGILDNDEAAAAVDNESDVDEPLELPEAEAQPAK